MNIVFAESISAVNAQAWNKLCGNGNPFIAHDFLLALEQHDCLQSWGWLPQHCLLYDNDELIGACPAYIKDNSYGEFVFDWAWADAYQRNGLDYYPKLVTAIPFTPARGPRLLAKTNHATADASEIKAGLIKSLLTHAELKQLSSAHFLFCEDDDIQLLQQQDLLLRYDYQYHWRNQAYTSFDDFLTRLTSKRRKNIKRERRKVKQENIAIEIIPGRDLNDTQWQTLYNYYRVTFMKKSGAPTLTLDFFRAVAHKLLAFFAYHEGKTVAGAICFEGDDTLYGRHWGCSDNYDSLHFELCYYTGIDYCIKKPLRFFEPGAQGEHKIWRGFLPVKTRSAHWVAHPGFRQAIRDFLANETRAMEQHGQLLMASSPFK